MGAWLEGPSCPTMYHNTDLYIDNRGPSSFNSSYERLSGTYHAAHIRSLPVSYKHFPAIVFHSTTLNGVSPISLSVSSSPALILSSDAVSFWSQNCTICSDWTHSTFTCSCFFRWRERKLISNNICVTSNYVGRMDHFYNANLELKTPLNPAVRCAVRLSYHIALITGDTKNVSQAGLNDFYKILFCMWIPYINSTLRHRIYIYF